MDPVVSTDGHSTDDHPDMRSGFMDLLGHRIADWKPDQVIIELDIGPQHLNRAGTVHGGVLAALIDVAASLAGLHCATPGNVRTAITLSLNSSFTRRASSGRIRAVGRKRAGGAKIYFSSVEITDEQGQVIALGEAVNSYGRGSANPQAVPALTQDSALPNNLNGET